MRAALERRGREIAARRADREADKVAEAVRDAAPDVRVTREGEDVVLSGRGLSRRRLRDPVLRWIGGLVR
ncbi:hypothetical protein [Stakelama saccharophila]|uniref:Uncharacterized protein n=1 Tax=Stakelama saccharophila TaxID=3075605 RepID=A0ABZ0B920_9SPHN|nr:hypothetical protein [Stakelama sp. W311]WNO53545.1 hypothetical protein RPR59_14060 [Stakelama sp. W311]